MILPPVRSRQDFVIVRADRLELITGLTFRFGDAVLILDRRQGDRRRVTRRRVQPFVDRRRARDRRRPLTEPEAFVWRVAGYRIVSRAGE